MGTCGSCYDRYLWSRGSTSSIKECKPCYFSALSPVMCLCCLCVFLFYLLRAKCWQGGVFHSMGYKGATRLAKIKGTIYWTDRYLYSLSPSFFIFPLLLFLSILLPSPFSLSFLPPLSHFLSFPPPLSPSLVLPSPPLLSSSFRCGHLGAM